MNQEQEEEIREFLVEARYRAICVSHRSLVHKLACLNSPNINRASEELLQDAYCTAVQIYGIFIMRLCDLYDIRPGKFPDFLDELICDRIVQLYISVITGKVVNPISLSDFDVMHGIIDDAIDSIPKHPKLVSFFEKALAEKMVKNIQTIKKSDLN